MGFRCNHRDMFVKRPRLFLGLLLVVVGCGKSAGDRVGISGTVTFDGQPVQSGSISFRPSESTRGPSAGAAIVDGAFVVPADKGVAAGQYRVEILGTRKTGRSFNDPVFGATDVDEQYIPARYNNRSELTADIRADNSNLLHFDLKSK